MKKYLTNNKLAMNLENLDIQIEDNMKHLLVYLLPKVHDNFKETLLDGRETLFLEESIGRDGLLSMRRVSISDNRRRKRSKLRSNNGYNFISFYF